VGTFALIEAALQLVGTADVPPKVNVLVPCTGPKPDPATVTAVPTAPDAGDKVVMLGLTVKATPLLGAPLAVTSTLPVVAPAGTGTTIEPPLQLVGDAIARLNLIVLVPCADPKLLPVIVTRVPGTPLEGLTLVIKGVMPANGIALLANPFRSTWTTPVNDPAGIVATICVSAHELMLVALKVPICRIPLLCELANPEPVTVTWVTPGVPLAGVTPVIAGAGSVGGGWGTLTATAK